MQALQSRKQASPGRIKQFFRLALSHDSAVNHYQTNFALKTHHGYSLSELDNMIPFEREIMCSLLQEHIKEQNEKAKANKS